MKTKNDYLDHLLEKLNTACDNRLSIRTQQQHLEQKEIELKEQILQTRSALSTIKTKWMENREEIRWLKGEIRKTNARPT